MIREMQFKFTELPLIIDPEGFEAAFVHGFAELSYDHDGNWWVGSIYLDGDRRKSDKEILKVAATGKGACFDYKPVEIEGNIFTTIYDRLCNEWRGRVESDIREQIERDYEDRDDIRADYINDRRREFV